MDSSNSSTDDRDSATLKAWKERCCSKLLRANSFKIGGRDRNLSCRKERSKGLVDVTGIEPVTPCLQS
jgi:hypothetical protein